MSTLDDILKKEDENKPVTTQQTGDATTPAAVEAAKGAQPVETNPKVDVALPGAKVDAANTGGLAAPAAHQPQEGEQLQRILTAMGYDAPETPEQRAKREKNEKWEKILSAVGDGVFSLADLYFAGKTGISNYDAQNSMSAKTRARWDKLNNERRQNARAYSDAYLRLKGMRDQEAHWREQMALQQQQAKQQQENWLKQFDYTKQQNDRQWDRLLANDKQSQENWQKTFDQNAKHLEFTEKMEEKKYRLSQANLARQSEGKDIDFLIGDNQTISLPKANLNAANISYLFNTLPESVRNSAHGKAITTQYGTPVTDASGKPQYEPLTSDQMLTVIFANVAESKDTQDALRTLAGQPGQPQQKSKGKSIDW